MSGSDNSRDGDDIIVHAVTIKEKQYFKQRLDPTTRDYHNIWKTLPKPKIVISLSGKNTIFSARPWYSAAFREVMLETMDKFGDFWIMSSVSCKCVRTLVEDLFWALEVRGFKKNDEKIPTVEELYGATCPADPDPDPDQLIQFEKYLSDQKVPMLDGSHLHMTASKSKLQMRVPLVVFVVEGDIQTLEHVTASIENNIPVVVIQGSGKMADVIAECMMGQDEVNKILSSRASNLLGCYIDAQIFKAMQENLKKIMDKHWLVQVFRIHELQAKEICHVISELIMTTLGVAPDHNSINSSQQNSKETNDPVVKQKDKQPLARKESVAQKSLIERPVKEVRSNLLFEALIGNDVELVQTLLSYDVSLSPSLLNRLYKEALRKPRKKDDVEQQNDVDVCDFDNCEQLYSIHKSFKKGAEDNSEKETDNSRKAIELFQSILNYGKNVKNEESAERKLQEMDLMLWSVLTHRPAIAEIFWRRGNHQILSALMASIAFKEMAKVADRQREKELAEEIEASSRLFQQNAVDLVNELYQQDSKAVYHIMEPNNKFTLWGIKTSVTTLAHNYDMLDFISTTPVQRFVTGMWYNDFENNDHFWKIWCHPWQALTAPITKFQIHYIVYIIFLISASGLVLTGIYHVEPPYTWLNISIWEWVLICYVFLDIIEELNSNIFNSGLIKVFKGSGQSLCHKLKRWITDFWNLLDFLSYILFLAMLASQFLWYEDATRRFFCLSLLFFYLRLLVIFIPIQTFGVIVMMIKQMLKDLIWFLPILAVFVVAFGIVYHSLMFPNHADLFHGSWEDWRIWRMLYIPYWQIYGESFLEAIEGNIMPDDCAENFTVWYEDPSRERCPHEDWMSPIISTVYVLVCNLLLVNLVIAMFSRTFQCVKENSQKIWCHYRFSLVLEHRYRIPPPFNIVRLSFLIVGLSHTITCKNNQVGACSENSFAQFVKQGAEKCLLSRKRKEWLAQKPST